tara:strand:- start:3290 stop:4222 length:933 start_codon:yes stop_codon:yes gene_type:complete
MVDTQQGTPAWFNARKGKLTASNFAAAAGLVKFKSRNKLLAEMLHPDPTPREAPAACLWGIHNEKNAIKDYMIRTGNVVRSSGLHTHEHYPWIGGSPDGLIGERGMIEVKCPFYVQIPHGRVPLHYLCQINGLMEIIDRDWCDFISWTPNAMRIYRVYRDPELWSYLLDRYVVFWSFMKAGCSKTPRVTDRRQLEARLEASEHEHVDYYYWSYFDYPRQHVSSPPPLSDVESDDEDRHFGMLGLRIAHDGGDRKGARCAELERPSKLPRMEGYVDGERQTSDADSVSTTVSGSLYEPDDAEMQRLAAVVS